MMAGGITFAILLLLLFDFLLLAYVFRLQWQAGSRQRLSGSTVDLPRLHVVQGNSDGTGVLVMVRTLREFTEESDGVAIPQNTLLWCSVPEARWLAQMHWAWVQWAVA
jgi:hypothetical protein